MMWLMFHPRKSNLAPRRKERKVKSTRCLEIYDHRIGDKQINCIYLYFFAPLRLGAIKFVF